MTNLAAFDFDHTIIKLNTDVVVASMIPGGVPESIKKLHHESGWTQYMQAVFDILHLKGFTKDSIERSIIQLDPVAGMTNLIKELDSIYNYDVIIISDSNSYFIDTWLTHHNLKKHISKVFTNPAKFVDGALKLAPYHMQDYCKLSSKNLCKGQILQDHISEKEKNGNIYEKILYAGDGANDLCPLMRLKKGDHAFVRSGYKLETMVQKIFKGEMKGQSDGSYKIQASVHYWNDGWNILENVKKLHSE